MPGTDRQWAARKPCPGRSLKVTTTRSRSEGLDLRGLGAGGSGLSDHWRAAGGSVHPGDRDEAAASPGCHPGRHRRVRHVADGTPSDDRGGAPHFPQVYVAQPSKETVSQITEEVTAEIAERRGAHRADKVSRTVWPVSSAVADRPALGGACRRRASPRPGPQRRWPRGSTTTGSSFDPTAGRR